MRPYLKIVSFIVFVIGFGNLAFAQKVDLTWEQLSKVTFEQEYQDAVGSYVKIPTFSPMLKTIEGREVEISGYVIPVDIEQGLYVLSANPFANCFFCGNAGPETVIELEFKKKQKRFNTDAFLRFKGKLQLNKNDIYRLNYILKEAVLLD